MSQKVFLSLAVLALCFCSLNSLSFTGCEVDLSGNFYSLDEMKNTYGWITPVNTSSNGSVLTNVSLYVDFCDTLNLTAYNCSYSSSDPTPSVLLLTNFTYTANDSSTYLCTYVSDQIDPNWQMQDPSNPNGGLIGNLTATDGSSSYNVQINLTCNSNASWFVTSPLSYNPDNQSIVIYASSSYACPKFSAALIWQFMGQYKAVFVPIFVIIGLFECFFGLRMLKPTLFIVGAAASYFIIMLFFFAVFVQTNTSTQTELILALVAFLPALAIGYFCVLFEKVGIFGLGGWFGVLLGLILYEAIVAQLHPAEWIVYVLLSVLGLVCGVLTLFVFKDVVIFATGLLGSYAAVRAASVLIGGYPNEFEVYHNIEATGSAGVSWPFYVYLVFIIGLAIGGVVFQFKTKKDEQDDEEGNVYRHNLPEN